MSEEAAVDDALTIDTIGKRCPVPIIELARQLPDIDVGGVVAVLSDDDAARVDIPVWCRMKRQEYVGATPIDGGVAYRVRRLV
jgi:cysteine desulfurase